MTLTLNIRAPEDKSTRRQKARTRQESAEEPNCCQGHAGSPVTTHQYSRLKYSAVKCSTVH